MTDPHTPTVFEQALAFASTALAEGNWYHATGHGTNGEVTHAVLAKLMERRDLLLRLAIEAGAVNPMGQTHCAYHRGFCHNPLDCDRFPMFYTTLDYGESEG